MRESIYKTKNVNGIDVALSAQEIAEHEARDAEWDADAVSRQTELARQQRAASFKAEADPLAFKMLRGETTKDEYSAKVDEIRARFPYPNPAA